MAVVKDYMHGPCRIIVQDDYYAKRTEEQQKEDMEQAKEVARQIILARYQVSDSEISK